MKRGRGRPINSVRETANQAEWFFFMSGWRSGTRDDSSRKSRVTKILRPDPPTGQSTSPSLGGLCSLWFLSPHQTQALPGEAVGLSPPATQGPFCIEPLILVSLPLVMTLHHCHHQTNEITTFNSYISLITSNE